MNLSPDISIVIPFLNEEENIANLGERLSEFVSENPQLSFEVILVDDGSTDNSVALIQQLRFPKLTKIILFSKNYGSHAALRAGIQLASGNLITFVYADLQDPLSLILQMHQNIVNNNDEIVWATRKETGTSGFEKAFSKWYANLMQRFVSLNFPEKGFDVVMFRRKVAELLNKNIEANSSIFLQILTLGFKQSFIFYDKQERIAGKSKWTLSKKVKLLIDSFVAFSFAPIRFVTLMGIFLFFLGTLWTLYIVCRELIYHDLNEGWPALISILMIGFGLTNISLGIIAEYLWRTLDASRNRPVFIISEIIDLNKT
jgi:dolichol-phosphate mannosyltransferase